MIRRRIGLVGNPNVGKSTLFNALTGMRQHTGNWPGKTVEKARGYFCVGKNEYELIDLPGTYSLFSNSKEEIITRDFVASKNYDMIVVVMDATCLRRTLLLGLQIATQCEHVLFVINLMDEAKKQGIEINLSVLEKNTHIPVVGLCAVKKKGICELKKRIDSSINKKSILFQFTYPLSITKLVEEYQEKNHSSTLQEAIQAKVYDSVESKEAWKDAHIEAQYHIAYDLCTLCVKETKSQKRKNLDPYITHPILGPIIMLAMLAIICFITIYAANVPSSILFSLFTRLGSLLRSGLIELGVSSWIMGLCMDGIYLILTFVVSVMLPPVAIFFTLFSYLEAYGLLPRIAFNLDGYFQKCQANGKQALSMCMGLGCNCVGVNGCRIMESDKDRNLGIITNSFMPCNGRFPTLITISAIFFISSMVSPFSTLIGTSILTICICMSIFSTLLVTYFLSRFVYGNQKATFILELPPYRKPRLSAILVDSLIHRTLRVLVKAIFVSSLAGAIIYLLASTPYLNMLVTLLMPFGRVIGVDGNVVVSLLLGLPANEIVLPILLMTYQGTAQVVSVDLEMTASILLNAGWNVQRAICFMILVLFHSPCITTLLAIYKETKSKQIVILSILVPSIYGILLCMGITMLFRLFQA